MGRCATCGSAAGRSLRSASSITACIAAEAAPARRCALCSGETPAFRSSAASASIRSLTFSAVDSGRMASRFAFRSAFFYGALSLSHRFSSIVETGAVVADAAKLIAPASKTFAPAGVS